MNASGQAKWWLRQAAPPVDNFVPRLSHTAHTRHTVGWLARRYAGRLPETSLVNPIDWQHDKQTWARYARRRLRTSTGNQQATSRAEVRRRAPTTIYHHRYRRSAGARARKATGAREAKFAWWWRARPLEPGPAANERRHLCALARAPSSPALSKQSATSRRRNPTPAGAKLLAGLV